MQNEAFIDKLTVKSWLYKVALPLLQILPPSIGYPLASRLGRRYFWLYERDWVNAYTNGLTQAFPCTSPETIHMWVYMHFGMMGREMLDVYHLKNFKKSTVSKRTKLNADCILNRPKPGGKILIMGHLGRPIMLSTALGLSGFKTGMLSQAVDERNPHLDKPTRSYLQYKMYYTVKQAGGRWITTEDNLKEMYTALLAGECLIIMLDLIETNPARQVHLPFLNGTLKVPPGIIRLAKRTNASLYYGRALDDNINTRCAVEVLSTDPEEALRQAASLLENDFIREPWQWWQWNQLAMLWDSNERT